MASFKHISHQLLKSASRHYINYYYLPLKNVENKFYFILILPIMFLQNMFATPFNDWLQLY